MADRSFNSAEFTEDGRVPAELRPGTGGVDRLHVLLPCPVLSERYTLVDPPAWTA